MKPWIFLAGLAVMTLLGGCGSPRGDKELLAELHKLSAVPDYKAEKIKSDEDLRAFWRKRGTPAVALLKELSPAIPIVRCSTTARAVTLKILRWDPDAGEKAVAVAKSLVAEAPAGGDLAAHADVYLAVSEFPKPCSKEPGERRNSRTFGIGMPTPCASVEELLTTYPKNRYVADYAKPCYRKRRSWTIPKPNA